MPADGFYEWKTETGHKQPYLVGLKAGGVFGMAGLWERWEKDGSVIESCTLLTTEPNDLLAEIHNRMPVILEPQDYAEWLDQSVQKADALLHLMRPFSDTDMQVVPVSTLVNNPRNEESACITPVANV